MTLRALNISVECGDRPDFERVTSKTLKDVVATITMVMTYTEVTLRYGLHAVHRSRMCLHPGDSTDVSHPEGSTVWRPLRITYHAVTFRISVHAVITLDGFSHALTSRKTPTKSPMAPGLRAHKKYPSSPISFKG